MKRLTVAIAILGVAMCASAHADEMDKYKDYTLQKYRDNLRSNTNKKVAEAFVKDNDLLFEDVEKMRICLSENAYTKKPDLLASEVLGWCKADRENNPKRYNERVDLDPLFKNFHPWDGSYIPLEKLIKSVLNDKESYKHDATTYRLILSPKDKKEAPCAVIMTKFFAKNGYGAQIRCSVLVKVDLKTLKMDVIESQGI